MSDLIRRDEVLQELADFEVPEDPDGSVYIAWGIGTAMRLTKNVVAVDAVEVVRCKDCKYAKDPGAVAQRYGEPGLRTCKNPESIVNRRLVSPKDFCPYGVRRPENMIERPWEEGYCNKCIHCVDGKDCSVYMLGMNYYFCPHVRDCEKFVERREENAVD